MRDNFDRENFENEERWFLERFKRLASSTSWKVGWIILWTSLLITPIASFKRVKVPSWTEAVKISKPFIIWNWWICQDVIKTWATWTWRSNDIMEVNVRPEQHEEKFDDLMTSDNVPVDFSSFVKLKVIDWKGPYLIERFWPDWYKNNVQQIVRTEFRDEIAKYPMTTLTTRQEILSSIQKKVFDEIDKFLKSNKIPVEVQEVILWKINPPDKIKDQLAETAAQQQRKKTEIEKTWAETERKNAETKRAEADNAYRNALWLSPQQFVELEKIKANKEIAKVLSDSKWNITVILWQSSNVQPVLDVSKR